MVNYYAVAKGTQIGVVTDWKECKARIDGFKGAVYKKFTKLADAEQFIEDNKSASIEPAPKKKPEEVSETPFEPDYWVYTDGSCADNGSKTARAGIGIYFGDGDTRNVSKQVEGKQSNNTAELGALRHLYDIIKEDVEKGKQIGIVSDSIYAIRCVSSYGQACEAGGWKKTIPNQELVKETYELYKDIKQIKFFHVKAHTDETDKHSIGNANADKLANQAIGLESCPYSASATLKAERIYLNVPFVRKDEIKALGGKWDPEAKKWYVLSDSTHLEKVLSHFTRTCV
jgi:ribonuclease HI